MGYGISISSAGTNVSTAKTSQLLLSSKYPFIKLDTQSSLAFQTINLIFFNDPPEPVGPSWNDTITTVYQFAHGLSYTPKIWALYKVVTPPLGATFYQKYFQESGLIGAHTADDSVSMYYTVDSQNVYFKVDKQNDGLGSANPLQGTVIQISVLVFVDDFSIS